nr:hypothetical protein Iba_chr01aCG17690 [Ipomoea batatas]GMC56126.1 hypothetical protein Iba_chr01fCG4160 [Ipomoea batatas]
MAEGDATATTGAHSAILRSASSTCWMGALVYVFNRVTSNPRFERPSSVSPLAFAEAGYRTVHLLFSCLGSSKAKTLPVALDGAKATSRYCFDN